MKKALVIDDSMAMRLAVSCILEETGFHTIEEADNGQSALDLLVDMPELPHLVLVDWNMPIKDGKSFIISLRTEQRFSSLPVLVMSSSSEKEDMETASSIGADSFIFKPFNQEDLQAKLSSMGI